MEQNLFETCVLYDDSICNLKCRYCYIDKNPSLLEIDKILDKSFEGDYYFNFSKKIFEQDKLKEIQIWGGEPSLHLDRTFNTIKQMIEYYPNLTTIMFSSNLTTSCFMDQLTGLIRLLNQFDKEFTIQLQMSIDGPTYLNDMNRGNKTTESFTKIFSKLISQANILFPEEKNIFLNCFFKPTLDSYSIRLLQSKEKIIEYYKFFEEYNRIAEQVKTSKFNFCLSIPNTACPSPHTKEEGLLFANFCKLSYEIEQENKQNKIFDYYKVIMPFNKKINKQDILNYGNCGTTRTIIGLLPNEMLSGCHNGFVELISDYKKYCNEETSETQNSTLDFNLFLNNQHNNKMVFPYKDLEKYRHQMESYFKPKSCFQIINLVSEIQLLAFNKQIDEKYLNLNEAINGANFFITHTAYCIRDNIGSTGSKSLQPIGLIKLLLNGAREYIELD